MPDSGGNDTDTQSLTSAAAGEEVVGECLTCALIKMGSSASYGDHSCPQCGACTSKTFSGY